MQREKTGANKSLKMYAKNKMKLVKLYSLRNKKKSLKEEGIQTTLNILYEDAPIRIMKRCKWSTYPKPPNPLDEWWPDKELCLGIITWQQSGPGKRDRVQMTLYNYTMEGVEGVSYRRGKKVGIQKGRVRDFTKAN